jgi:hypothetical protein
MASAIIPDYLWTAGLRVIDREGSTDALDFWLEITLFCGLPEKLLDALGFAH